MKAHDAAHGIEIIEGLPGSGKTFFAVKRVLRVIREQKRPVYTNLPLRMKVVKARLRNIGGEELASLIRPLNEHHWRSYLRRHQEYTELLERHAKISPADEDEKFIQDLAEVTGRTPEAIRAQHSIHPNQMRAYFISKHGDDVYEGPEANEIPAFAVIVIDEVQNWHSMIDQSRDPDRQKLLQYISKHRHSLHWLWVITQDCRNISIEFRRQAHSIWKVMSLGDQQLAWGLKFKHLRINATLYKRYTHEQWEMKDRNGDTNAETFILYTKLPWLRKIYRYYEPFTNSGSKKQLEKQLQKARRKAGLSETGLTREEEMKLRKQATFISRLGRKVMKRAIQLGLILLAFIVGFTANKNKEGDIANDGDDQVAQAVQNTQERVSWPRWTIAGKQPWIGGQKRAIGDDVGNGALYRFSNPTGDVLVLVRDDAYWVWNYGEQQPRRVGDVQAVRNAVSQARADGRLPDPGFEQP